LKNQKRKKKKLKTKDWITGLKLHFTFFFSRILKSPKLKLRYVFLATRDFTTQTIQKQLNRAFINLQQQEMDLLEYKRVRVECQDLYIYIYIFFLYIYISYKYK